MGNVELGRLGVSLKDSRKRRAFLEGIQEIVGKDSVIYKLALEKIV